ncbi:MAG: hypothetical protein ACLRWP_16305 [Bilophila wadsworthia]
MPARFFALWHPPFSMNSAITVTGLNASFAHAPTEQIRGIYNRAEYLPERRRMLQEWADYLDGLKSKTRQEVDLE